MVNPERLAVVDEMFALLGRDPPLARRLPLKTSPPTTVTFELTPEADGTRLQLTHLG